MLSPLLGSSLRRVHDTAPAPTPPYLQVSVNDPVGLKIIVILSEGVDELLCHLWGRWRGGGLGSENLDTLVPILSLGSGHSHSLMMPFLPNNCLQGHRIGPRHPPHGASMFLVSTLKTTAVPSCVTQPNHPLDLTLVTSSPQVALLFGTLIYLPRCTCLLFYGIRDKC